MELLLLQAQNETPVRKMRFFYDFFFWETAQTNLFIKKTTFVGMRNVISEIIYTMWEEKS